LRTLANVWPRISFNMFDGGVETESNLKRFDLRGLFLRFTVVIFVALLFGVMVPAATAYYSGVFFWTTSGAN
jgi:hypothetical protein